MYLRCGQSKEGGLTSSIRCYPGCPEAQANGISRGAQEVAPIDPWIKSDVCENVLYHFMKDTKGSFIMFYFTK